MNRAMNYLSPSCEKTINAVKTANILSVLLAITSIVLMIIVIVMVFKKDTSTTDPGTTVKSITTDKKTIGVLSIITLAASCLTLLASGWGAFAGFRSSSECVTAAR